MSAAAPGTLSDTSSPLNLLQRLRRRITKSKKSYEVAPRSASCGRTSRRSPGKYNRVPCSYTQYEQRRHRHGREVVSENEQTDGELEDDCLNTSCPNTPLKGYISDTELTLPCHFQDIKVVVRQSPSPGRNSHRSRQHKSPSSNREHSGGGTSRNLHSFKSPQPDVVDPGYHEFIKDGSRSGSPNIEDINRRKVHRGPSPLSFRSESPQGRTCPHGLTIPNTVDILQSAELVRPDITTSENTKRPSSGTLPYLTNTSNNCCHWTKPLISIHLRMIA